MQNEKTSQEKDNFLGKINDFIQRNRKPIFAVTGIIVFLFVGAVVFLAVNDSLNKKAIIKAEEFNTRYEYLTENFDDEDFKDDINGFINDIAAFAGRKKGVAYSKAWSLAADLHTRNKDWQNSQEAWVNAARAGDNYLAPIAFFNAAAAAEEQGNIEQAIDLLKQCLSLKVEFPAAPRAQFSVGRLYEQLGDFPQALEAYREVMINWPEIPVWHQLARSRIIAIEIQ
ncbi:MAG: tetratricopeptide repeat protein [Treponema sp.]|nr:tetratricopeptide repeat protein [Treponema sp.]